MAHDIRRLQASLQGNGQLCRVVEAWDRLSAECRGKILRLIDVARTAERADDSRVLPISGSGRRLAKKS